MGRTCELNEAARAETSEHRTATAQRSAARGSRLLTELFNAVDRGNRRYGIKCIQEWRIYEGNCRTRKSENRKPKGRSRSPQRTRRTRRVWNTTGTADGADDAEG